MSVKTEDEEYWFGSQKKRNVFDEDDEFESNSLLFATGSTTVSFKGYSKSSISGTASIADTIFEGISNRDISSDSKVPVASLISQSSLHRILKGEIPQGKQYLSSEEEIQILKRKVQNQWKPDPVKKTIRCIMLGQPYSLELYRSFELKQDLLDEAIQSGDGNAILAVTFFLSKTLKKSLFYQLLRTYPVAAAHFASHLTTRLQLMELTDLYGMLGQTREAAMKQYQVCASSTQSVENKIHKLKSCLNNHFSVSEAKERNYVVEFINLLEWQLAVGGNKENLVGQPALYSLAYACRNHWNESKENIRSPLILSKKLNICDRQFQWTVLMSRASFKCWHEIDELFITKDWFGHKKVKSIIPVEKIVLELHEKEAPNEIVNKYLELMEDVEKKLKLAKKLKCHKVVIDVYVARKDKQGLTDYKANMHPQTEDYLYAEHALKTAKWR